MAFGVVFGRALAAEMRSVRWYLFTAFIALVAVLLIVVPIKTELLTGEEWTAASTWEAALLLPLVPGIFVLSVHALMASAARGAQEWQAKTFALLYSRPGSPWATFVAQASGVWLGQALSLVVVAVAAIVAGAIVDQDGVASSAWMILVLGTMAALYPICLMGTALGQWQRRAAPAMFLGLALAGLLLPVVGAGSAMVAMQDDDFRYLGDYYGGKKYELASACTMGVHSRLSSYESAVFQAKQGGPDPEPKYVDARQAIQEARTCRDAVYADDDAFYEEAGLPIDEGDIKDLEARLAWIREFHLSSSQTPSSFHYGTEDPAEQANETARHAHFVAKFEVVSVTWSRYLNPIGLLTIGQNWADRSIVKDGAGPLPGSAFVPFVAVVAYGEGAVAFDVRHPGVGAATIALLGHTVAWMLVGAVLSRRDLAA